MVALPSPAMQDMLYESGRKIHRGKKGVVEKLYRSATIVLFVALIAIMNFAPAVSAATREAKPTKVSLYFVKNLKGTEDTHPCP